MGRRMRIARRRAASFARAGHVSRLSRPWAPVLVSIEGVGSVLLGDHSITVNREPHVDWRPLGQAVSEAIREWENSAEPALGLDYQPPAPMVESEAPDSYPEDSGRRHCALCGAGWRRGSAQGIRGWSREGQATRSMRELPKLGHYPEGGDRVETSPGNPRGPTGRVRLMRLTRFRSALFP